MIRNGALKKEKEEKEEERGGGLVAVLLQQFKSLLDPLRSGEWSCGVGADVKVMVG